MIKILQHFFFILVFIVFFLRLPDTIYAQSFLSPPCFSENHELLQDKGIPHYYVPLSWPGISDRGKDQWNIRRLRPITWQQPHSQCPLCKAQSTDLKPLYKVNYSRLVRCSHCGLVLTDPQPDFTVTEGNYHHIESYKDAHGKQKISPMRDYILKLYPDIVCNKKILDFGCNSGLLLYGLWEKMGFSQESAGNLYGIDSFTQAIAEGEKMGLINLFTDLRDLKDIKFDLIIISKTIEHLYNPIEVLKSLKRFLKPEGMIMILMVPNLDCIVRPKGLRTSILTGEPAEHLFHFDIHSFSLMVKTAGYDIDAVCKTNRDFGIFWGAESGNKVQINHTFDVFARHYNVIERAYPLDDYSVLDYDEHKALKTLEQFIKRLIYDINCKFKDHVDFQPIQIPDDAFDSKENFLSFLRSLISNPFYGTEFSAIIKPFKDNEIKKKGVLTIQQTLSDPLSESN
ncbi:MAG: methyltransferase domain-containing protein [Elusimicrobia bacterium]|nr:methyltransferase domain-containing protein [Elusimicrobiota bacterium]MBD3412288.1 methyltransferase domain-containing protein [Elusimicrobiota bacterium]